MKWIDTYEIVDCLLEKYPNIDPLTIKFTDLQQWVMSLDDFNDDANCCGEKILEAIQMTWLNEID